MKKGRFTEAQIVSILNEWDAGTAVAELSRRHGVHANTLRLWRSKYGGLEVTGKEVDNSRSASSRRYRTIDSPRMCEILCSYNKDCERSVLRLGPKSYLSSIFEAELYRPNVQAPQGLLRRCAFRPADFDALSSCHRHSGAFRR